MDKQEKGESKKTISIKTGLHQPVSGEWSQRQLSMRSIGDYSGVADAHLVVARLYSSPLLIGPPLCDELIALVEHMFTEEEAEVARHLKPLSFRTAHKVARLSHRPVEEVSPILDGLAKQKYVLLSKGQGQEREYTLLPIVPGTFEHVLMRKDLDTLTDWHREFMRLFEDLYDTGYLTQYHKRPVQGVRYLPVQQSIADSSSAWPSDQLEQVLDRYKIFAVGLCQCRMTTQHLGSGCDRPLEVCAVFGDWAQLFIDEGRMRQVSKGELIEIKHNAEKQGLVSWMMNEESGRAVGVSCSCCGCCCHALRSISEFNAPGFIAPGHFEPRLDLSACSYCGKCQKACPMGAIQVNPKAKLHTYLPERCIGCGLCAVACEKEKAIIMQPKKDYKKPPGSWTSLLARVAPNHIVNTISAWRKYR